MPGKGTPHRGIRIDDALWAEFQAATQAAGTNPSETIRQLIRDWTNTRKQGEQNEYHSADQSKG